VYPALALSSALSNPPPRMGLPALTGARFFAAFAVVVYHYGTDSVRAIAEVLASIAAAGPAAVSFFYVLSGAGALPRP